MTLLLALLLFSGGADAAPAETQPSRKETLNREAARLLKSYPDFLASYRDNTIVWRDGTRMIFDDGRTKTHDQKLAQPDLEDQVSECYPTGPLPSPPRPGFEPGRIRYDPFFRKMYGDSRGAVQGNLERFRWQPSKMELEATRVNGVAQRLEQIGTAFSAQGADVLPFVSSSLGGTFNWRSIAGESRLSAHSFGIAMDVSTRYSDYWRWSGGPNAIYRNRIPQPVVTVFENAKFIWGGKWYRFDTMHFEYRPEMFCGN